MSTLKNGKKKWTLVAKMGIEPMTFPLLGECSILLSYSATTRYDDVWCHA